MPFPPEGTQSFSYDDFGRIAGIAYPGETGQTVTIADYQYDAAGDKLGFLTNSGTSVISRMDYNVRGELVGQAATWTGGPLSLAQQSANGHLVDTTQSTGTVTASDWDARTGALLGPDPRVNADDTTQYMNGGAISYANGWANYNARGDLIGTTQAESVRWTGKDGSACYASINITAKRSYDIDNHITTLDSGMESEGTAPHPPSSSAQLCSVGRPSANPIYETYAWGPNGHPSVIADNYTATGRNVTEYAHWDGASIAYTSATDIFPVGASPTTSALGVDRVFIGDFATYTPSTFSAATVSVDFRDENGTALASLGNAFGPTCHNPTPSEPRDIVVCAPRSDGYQLGLSTIQGVRAYDPGSAQWITPDAYAGMVSDPMSQQSYMWNGNNPVAYGDPSGFKVKHENVNTMDLSAGPCGTSPNSAACQKQIAYILHQENLQIGVFKGYLVLMTSPLGSEGGPAVSRLANIAAFGSSDGRVFGSGYVNGAKDAAEILAERVGGKTLEMTPAGRIAGSLPREFQDSWLGRRIWVFLSRGFAGGTSDVARAVIWTDKAATIWKTVELPILNNNGIPIIYY